MAQIPRLTTTSVDPTVSREYQGPRENIGNVAAEQAGALAGAIGKVGSEFMAVQAKLDQEKDEQTVLSAQTRLKQMTLEQQRTVRSATGANARGIAEKSGSDWKKAREEIAKDLTPKQRLLFDQHADEIGMQHTDMAARHEWAENRAALQDAAVADIETTRQMTAANTDDPAQIAKGRADIQGKVEYLAGIQGWDKERTKLEMSKQMTALHSDVIESLLLNDPKAAKAYYAQAKPEMAMDARTKVERALKTGNARVTAQEFADKYDWSDPAQIAKAREDAREKFEGEEEHAVVNELNMREAERRDLINAGFKQAADTAWDVYGNTRDVRKIPASVLEAMDGKDRVALEDYAKAKIKGDPIRTDMNTWLTLNELSQTDFRAFAQLDLRQFLSKLSESDIQRFSVLQGKKDDTAAQKDIATLGTQVASAVRSAGLVGKNRPEDADVQRGVIEREIYDRIWTLEEQEKRKLNDKERQEVIDQVIMRGTVVEKGIFGLDEVEKMAYQLTPEEIDAFTPSPDVMEMLAKRYNVANGPALLAAVRNAMKRGETFRSYRRQGIPANTPRSLYR